MAKVKSMLFTIGLMMLSLVILILAIIIFNSSQKSELTMSGVGALDRAYEMDTSIQNVLRSLFYKTSGISIEVDIANNAVSFEETIPSNNTIFNLTIMDFRNFTESNFNYVSLDLARISKELPLVILPHNIEYKHLDFGERTIEITPQLINFNKYEILLTLYSNITLCPNIYDEITDFDVYIRAIGPEAECSSRKIEPDIDNKVQTEDGFVYLRADSDGKLIITANNTKARAETKVWLNPLDNLRVEYPAGIIKINLTDVGVLKTSSVRMG